MRIAIYGYGHLGRGAALAAAAAKDAELIGIFTRRDPAAVDAGRAPVYAADSLPRHVDKIDVLLLCGGSARDLPHLSPRLAKDVNLVESFDTHAKFFDHFSAVDNAAKAGGHLALVGGGWDPGLFSCVRVLSDAILPRSRTRVLFGPGVSQGHSNAAAGVRGVAAARAYTLPREDTDVWADLPTEALHRRVVYAVLDGSREAEETKDDILALAPYFSRENTEVRFIPADDFAAHHTALSHSGRVLSRGTLSESSFESSFSLTLDSNPLFTGAVLVACARAIDRMARRGIVGACTMADLAPADLSARTREELLRSFL